MFENKISYLYPRSKTSNTSLRIEDIKKILSKIFNVNENYISIDLLGGMTNTNFKITINSEHYILRIPGNGTEKFINRYYENYNRLIANQLGLDTNVIYFNEDSGIKLSKFINNGETINPKTAKNKKNMVKITSLLRLLHKSNKKFSNEFNVFNKIEEYEKILEESNGINFKDYDLVKQKVMDLKESLKGLGVESVPCHNDTVAENFIKKDDRLYLIDWEYSGMNDPMWDLASHCLECDFSIDEEDLFLKLYFNNKVEDKYRKRIFIYKICQDFLWSIWTNIKEANGEDLGTYGEDRYNRAKINLNKFFEEECFKTYPK